ncbi:MAG: fatty acid desaturase [Sphingorhabdus sp.]
MYSSAAYIKLTRPFMARDMRIYWADWLLSYAALIGGAALWLTAGTALAITGLIAGTYAAYRCGSFMHEIVHFDRRKKGEMAFKGAWNLFFGIPIMSPSHLYDSHLEHHMPDSFGTVRDPEYVPINNRSFLGLANFVFGHVLGPISMVALRMLLNPVIWIFPSLGEKLMHGKGTALVINWDYIPTGKQQPTGFDRFAIFAATLLLYVYIALIATGVVPLLIAAKILILVVVSMVLNGVRTLVAHRYINYDGESVNKQAQLTDSINLVGNPLIGGLFAPVGLRFHALHHLVQTLPYHGLAKAHAKLMEELPAEDAYRTVNVPISQAMIELKRGERRGENTPIPAT